MRCFITLNALLFILGLLVGCKSKAPRDLTQWKQRTNLTLPVNPHTRQSLKPVLVIEITKDSIKVDDSQWIYGAPKEAQTAFRKKSPQRKNKQTGIPLTKGRVSSKYKKNADPDSFLIHPLYLKLKHVAQQQKEMQRLIVGKVESYTQTFDKRWYFRGEVLLLIHRTTPYRTVVETLHTLAQAQFPKFTFVLCTQHNKAGLCTLKGLRIHSPRSGQRWNQTSNITIQSTGLYVSLGKKSITKDCDPAKAKQSKKPILTFPLTGGTYDYQALTECLTKIKKKSRVVLYKKKFRKPKKIPKNNRPTPKEKAKSLIENLVTTPLAHIHKPYIIITATGNIPYHALIATIAATQKTTQGKDLYNVRWLSIKEN